MNILIKLHKNEQGSEGAEKLLIIAAIILPLLGFLIYARDWIKDWIGTDIQTVKNDSGSPTTTGF